MIFFKKAGKWKKGIFLYPHQGDFCFYKSFGQMCLLINLIDNLRD